MTRKSISKRRRFEIFKRDNFTCQYCGRRPPTVVLQLDHVIPVCQGGDDSTANLVAACEDCNAGKSGVPLDQAIEVVETEVERGRERLAQMKAVQKLAIEERKFMDAAVEEVAAAFGWDHPLELTEDRSIRVFLQKLPLADVLNAVNICQSKIQDNPRQQFKYFCGICWSRIRESGR